MKKNTEDTSAVVQLSMTVTWATMLVVGVGERAGLRMCFGDKVNRSD